MVCRKPTCSLPLLARLQNCPSLALTDSFLFSSCVSLTSPPSSLSRAASSSPRKAKNSANSLLWREISKWRERRWVPVKVVELFQSGFQTLSPSQATDGQAAIPERASISWIQTHTSYIYILYTYISYRGRKKEETFRPAPPPVVRCPQLSPSSRCSPERRIFTTNWANIKKYKPVGGRAGWRDWHGGCTWDKRQNDFILNVREFQSTRPSCVVMRVVGYFLVSKSIWIQGKSHSFAFFFYIEKSISSVENPFGPISSFLRIFGWYGICEIFLLNMKQFVFNIGKKH